MAVYNKQQQQRFIELMVADERGECVDPGIACAARIGLEEPGLFLGDETPSIGVFGFFSLYIGDIGHGQALDDLGLARVGATALERPQIVRARELQRTRRSCRFECNTHIGTRAY